MNNNLELQKHTDKIKELDSVYVKAITESIKNLCQAIYNAQTNGLSVKITGFNGVVTDQPFPNYNPIKLSIYRDIDLIDWQSGLK